MKEAEEDAGSDVPDGFCERSPQGRYLRTSDLLSESTEKSTYRGFDTRNAIEVAWHILRLDKLTTGDIRRLSGYTDIISKLDNPRIIEYHTAWKNMDRHEVVIITETTAAGSLRTFLQKLAVIRWRTIKKWCRQILRGLNYLHSLDPPVIHRDLNCDHIYINSGRAGDLRIGDLWLSSELTQEISNNVSWQNLWAPPETQEGVNDTKTDIFAYGMCVLEMITRQSPFKKEVEDADVTEDEYRARRKVWQAVRKGGYPYAFYLVSVEVARNFIARCLAPHDERPDAETLLQDPFLQQDDSLDDLEVTLLDPSAVPADISRVSSDEISTDDVLPRPAPCTKAEIEELLRQFPVLEDIQKDVRLLEGRVDEDEEEIVRPPSSASPPPSQSKRSPRPQQSPTPRSDKQNVAQPVAQSPAASSPKAAALPATATSPTAVAAPSTAAPAAAAPTPAPAPAAVAPVKVTVELQMGENLVVFDFEVGVDSYETVASEMQEQLHLKDIDVPQLAKMIEDYVRGHSQSQSGGTQAAVTAAAAAVAAAAVAAAEPLSIVAPAPTELVSPSSPVAAPAVVPTSPSTPQPTAQSDIQHSPPPPEQSRAQPLDRSRSPGDSRADAAESAAKAQPADIAASPGGEASSEATSNPAVDKKLRAVLSSESLVSDHGGEDEDMGKRDDDAQKELLRAQHVFNFRRKKLEDSQSNYQQEGEKLTQAYEKEIREIADKMAKLVQERDEQLAALAQEIQSRRIDYLAKCREEKYHREAQRRLQSQQLQQRQLEQQQRMLQQYWLLHMPSMLHAQQFTQMQPNFSAMPTPSPQDWELLNSALAPEDRTPYPMQFLQQQQQPQPPTHHMQPGASPGADQYSANHSPHP